MYWVSFIQKDSKDSEPRLCAAYNSCISLDEAKKNIVKQRKLYDVLSAWIEVYGEEKEIVFYECYVDSCGYIKKPSETGPYTVKYEQFGRYYSDEYTYETEKEANDAIESEIDGVMDGLTRDEYDIEDFGNCVEITPTGSTTALYCWTRMWK